MRVDEDNRKLREEEGLGKFGGFQEMNIGRTLVASFWRPPLVLKALYYGRRRRKYISGKKRKINSMRGGLIYMRIVLILIFLCHSLFYFDCTNTQFPLTYFCHISHQGV